MTQEPQTTSATSADQDKKVVKFPPLTGRELIDLAEWPVVTMHHTPVRRAVVIDNILTGGTGDAQIPQGWELALRSVDLGAPMAGDQDVYVAIMACLHQSDFRERILRITRADICRTLGWQPNDDKYNRIRDALSRLRNVTYKGRNIFKDPNTGARFGYIEFGFVDSFAFSDRPPKRSSKHPQPELPLSYVRVSDEFLILCRQGNLKVIDLEFYRALSRPETRWLFRFLDKNLFKRSEYRIGFRKLRLRQALNPDYDPKYIKRDLKPRLEELTAKGFLESWSFERGNDPDDPWLLRVKKRASFGLRRALAQPQVPTPQRAPERAAAPCSTRNSPIPEPGPAADLVAYFHELFHGAARVSATATELAKGRDLLARCGGDVDRAKGCIEWIRKEARQTNFAIQSFGGLLSNGYPERYEAMRVAEQEARQRAVEHDHAQRLQLAYELWCDEESKRLFEALPVDEQERLIEAQAQALDAEFGHKLDRFAWTPERRREWSQRRAVSTYAKGRLLAPQEWLAQRDELSAEPTVRA